MPAVTLTPDQTRLLLEMQQRYPGFDLEHPFEGDYKDFSMWFRHKYIGEHAAAQGSTVEGCINNVPDRAMKFLEDRCKLLTPEVSEPVIFVDCKLIERPAIVNRVRGTGMGDGVGDVIVRVDLVIWEGTGVNPWSGLPNIPFSRKGEAMTWHFRKNVHVGRR